MHAGPRRLSILAIVLFAAVSLVSAQGADPQPATEESGGYYITVFPDSIKSATQNLASAAGAQQVR